MKIAILTHGTRGDVQPLIALGIGLQQTGHDVLVVASPSFTSLVHSHGLNCSAMRDESGFPPDEDLVYERINSGQNLLQIALDIGRGLNAAHARMREDMWAACQGTEAIIDSTPSWGCHIAERLNVPYYFAQLWPFTPTKAFPTMIMPKLPFGGIYNLLTHKFAQQLAWQPMRKTLNLWRTQTFGLEPLPFLGPDRHQKQQQQPTLYGYSSAVIPKPGDWPSHVHVTGYWFLDPVPQWQPPARLLQFLQAGPPPVYIGFGSMALFKSEAVLRLAVQALKHAEQRGIVLGNPRNVTELPDDILVLNDIPHAWLFPHMAAVVHHGGAGTTGAALRAGFPSLVVPFYIDQPFWGRKIAELGVGPPPLFRKHLSPETLAARIRTAVSDPTIRERAAALGRRIRAEDGVAQAVEIFHAHLPTVAYA